MAKRGILDREIALIKAMRARGMKNKDIQFMFNRPDRAVNSGRISNIAAGVYGHSKDIAAATNEELDAFIAQNSAVGSFSAVKVPIVGKLPIPPNGPVDLATLSAMFTKDRGDVWRLAAGETDQHECKVSFGFKHSGQWLRAIAALANNRGGYVLFGVHDKDDKAIDGMDKSYAVIGLDDDMFKAADPAEFTKRIKSTLDPTPRYQIATLNIDGKEIGVIHVEQHASRPVIVTRPEGDKMREGDILFRYVGQSDRIKYSDLRAILDARDAQARQDVLPMVERLLALGPSRALVADLTNGTLGDGKQQIVIDPELVKQINFVREGDFTQTNGAPALKLVGEVMQLTDKAAATERLIRDAVLEEDIVRNFLEQAQVERPEAYVRASLDHQKKWLPIFYYVKLSGKTPSDIATMIGAQKTTHRRKQHDLIDRLNSKLSAKGKPGTAAVKTLTKSISDGVVVVPVNCKQASNLANAVVSLQRTKADLPVLLAALRKAKDIAEGEGNNGVIGTICRAVCRLDELFFSTAS